MLVTACGWSALTQCVRICVFLSLCLSLQSGPQLAVPVKHKRVCACVLICVSCTSVHLYVCTYMSLQQLVVAAWSSSSSVMPHEPFLPSLITASVNYTQQDLVLSVIVSRSCHVPSLLLLSAAKRLLRVTFDYNAMNEDELTLKIGDIVEFLGDDEEGWYKGQLKGKIGVFPSNFVEEASSTAPSGVTSTDGKQTHSATVSDLRPSKPPPPIPSEGGSTANHHADTAPPAPSERDSDVLCRIAALLVCHSAMPFFTIPVSLLLLYLSPPSIPLSPSILHPSPSLIPLHPSTLCPCFSLHTSSPLPPSLSHQADRPPHSEGSRCSRWVSCR